ncbi:MAG: hypothetical protein WKF77_11365 [Planctomycetaceae bacterium]
MRDSDSDDLAVLTTINEHMLGQLFQMLMLAAVVEGCLVGTNPYGQPGAKAWKKSMQKWSAL